MRPSVLEKRVIVQRLQSIQWVNQRRDRGPRVPLSQIAEFLGVSRPTLYAALRGEMSETTQIRLSIILERIEWGELGFRRVGQTWEVGPAPKGPPPIRMRIIIPASGPPRLSVIPRATRPPDSLPMTIAEALKR